LAFETRLASNNVANRTMSSFVPGTAKKSNDKIMVRGYWGDIIQSPYITFGVELWKTPEKSMFKKQINFQAIYSSADFALFNVQNYITILEDLQEYHFPFTRIKQVEKQHDDLAGVDEEEEKKTEEIKEGEETKSEAEAMLEKLKTPGKSIDLESIDEGDLGASQQQEGDRVLLRGLRETKVRFHLLAEPDLAKLATKR